MERICLDKMVTSPGSIEYESKTFVAVNGIANSAKRLEKRQRGASPARSSAEFHRGRAVA